MIKVNSLSKSYSTLKAIDEVSFQIADGEIVGLLGLNGAGKSTILKMLSCYLMPSSGVAHVGGYSIKTDPHGVRRVIGYLPDYPPLYNEMTVKNYLFFVAGLKEIPVGNIKSSVDKAMERTNIKHVENVNIGTLSHGYRQRIGICQALVHEPKLLILDEPISGLDPIQIVEMRDLILSLRGDHTVLLSSHILSEITKTCDRILVLDRGKLVAEGTEDDLKATMAFNTQIEVEWRGNIDSITATINCLEEIRATKRDQQDNRMRISMEALTDIRPKIADLIVKGGGELLSLNKIDAGLESLFVKLVQSK